MAKGEISEGMEAFVRDSHVLRRSGDVDQIPPFQAGRLVVLSSPPRGTPVSGLY